MRIRIVMRIGIVSCAAVCLCSIFSTLYAQSDSETTSSNDTWLRLPSIRNSVGVAGPFAGSHNGVLILAGGANFPDKMPWQGGTKVRYDDVDVLTDEHSEWTNVGKLPRPLGYGVSLSTPMGVICIGGSDAKKHYADCFVLQWNGDRLTTVSLPDLPMEIANMCGTFIEDRIYIAGGTTSPDSTSALQSFLYLDLTKLDQGWHELEPCPGPGRMLAVAAASHGKFYLFSGASMHADNEGKPKRTYLRDAYRFESGKGWERIADLPYPVVAAPSPAVLPNHSKIMIFGGDDGTRVGFQPPGDHPGFLTTSLVYDVDRDRWAVGSAIPFAPVTTTTVGWKQRWIVPSGEVRPGIRTPEVWSIRSEAR